MRVHRVSAGSMHARQFTLCVGPILRLEVAGGDVVTLGEGRHELSCPLYVVDRNESVLVVVRTDEDPYNFTLPAMRLLEKETYHE